MRQHTLFIADLHLDENFSNTIRCYANFITQYAPFCDAVYILGDFFEYWIGDDATTTFHKEIIHYLKQLTSAGTPVYFMRGNRDFLIDKQFAQSTACNIISDPYVIHLYGQAVLLTHGDSLCSLDVRHLRFRKMTEKRLLRQIFLSLPISLRQSIAKKMRSSSKNHTKTLSAHMMDVTDSSVVKYMTQYQTQYLIHGHTHRPEIHQVQLGSSSENPMQGERIVLGAWHDQGNALKWYADGNKELIWF